MERRKKLGGEKSREDVVKDGGKRKKTRFEEYLEGCRDGISKGGEYDLKKEKELAKKLGVKNGKLGGVDDMLNDLLGEFCEGDEEEEHEQDLLGGKGRKSRKGRVAEDEEVEMESEEEEEEEEEEPEEILLEKCKRRNKKKADEVVVDAREEIKGKEAVEKESVPQELLPEKSVKWVPPHMRKMEKNELDEYAPMRRRVKGLLNRMSESNVESVTGEIFTCFQEVPRNIGSQIIIEEVLKSVGDAPRGIEQLAAVSAAFVAGMACLAGMDIGAKLLASLAKSFEDEYHKKDNISLRNYTLLLCYLCIFGVCSSDLIFDFLILLSKQLLETDVATILTILQCCGMKLRSDDPAGMKDFILSVQNKVNELKSSNGDGTSNIDNKRMEFMLQTICEIKNNKRKAKDDPVQLTQMRKWLQKMHSEDILLRQLKWSKLLDLNKKGQWWLPGADVVPSTNHIEEVAHKIDKEVLETQKLLQLASAQGMNTDARKAIFCIIMSGEDYLDAFEKLIRLDMAGKQDREIVRVLVKCCLQETVFNKYYTALASKLCGHDKNHKFSLQYCLWDHYKSLETLNLQKSMHLARFAAEMFSSFSLSLSVLKAVDFSNVIQLNPKMIMHLRMLLEYLLEYPNKTVWNTFTRIAAAHDLEILRTSIGFFVKEHVVSRNKSLATKFKVAKKALKNLEGVIM